MTKETKHTSGPWRKVFEAGCWRIVDNNRFSIASVWSEGKPDAHLIAAAPELLISNIMQDLGPPRSREHHQAILQFLRDHGWQEEIPADQFISQYRKAAINKAKGQS